MKNKRKTKRWKQLLAAMLAITLLVTSVEFPTKAAPADETSTTEVTEDATIAEDATVTEDATMAESEPAVEEFPDDSEGTSEDTVSEEEVEEPRILTEVEEEREEDSKTFLMSDGTFMVAQYGTPVHYEDENKEWQEIDNSLMAETARSSSSDSEDGYTTTEKSGNRDRIKFSKKLKEGKTVSIKNTDFPISWGIKDAAKQTVQVVDIGEKESKDWNDKFLMVDTGSQLLRYADIFEGVDAEYIIQSEGVKENIILKEKGTKTSFEIVYDIGKLTPVQTDEQTIQLMDGEEMIYQIRAPYMEDAEGQMSDELTLSMEQTKKKEIVVTMIADEAWLSEEGRVYPVTLDPTILTERTRSTVDSVFISSKKNSDNFADRSEMLVGRESTAYGYCRTLVKFVLPDLSTGDMVVAAEMNLYMDLVDKYVSNMPELQANAHIIEDSWNVNNVTWDDNISFDSTVLDYNYLMKSEENSWQGFDITEAVKGWYEGTIENNGILLKSANENGTLAENCIKAQLWPERNGVSDGYPVIMITYRNNKGLEDYWTYTSLSAGTAGTAYINDYTGNLVFVHNDVSTTGELMPVTLQHVYNSYMMDKRFTGSYPSAGRGWKLSIQQTVLSSEKYGLTGESLEAFPYAYEDGDGTVHFFYKKTKDGKTEYLDENGLGLELKINGSTKTITDKEKNVMTFGPKGNLTSIADIRGNTITVTYKDAADGKSQITKITDGAGHVIKLEEHNTTLYNLKTITDPSGRATTYTYTAYNDATGNKAVTKILYPDGTYSEYTYGTQGQLLEAVSSDGSKLKFTYTSKEQGWRIKKVAEYGTDGSVGQTITFDRSKYNTTVIRTSGSDDAFNNDDDLLTTYRFDNFGRTIATNTKTYDGSVYYGGESQSFTAGDMNTGGGNIGKLNRVSGSSYNNKAVRNFLKNHSGEDDDYWNNCYWLDPGSTYTAQMTSSEKYFGNRSLAITGTKVNVDGGGAYNQAVSTSLAKPGKTYTFSGYIKTSNVTKANNVDAGYGACLAVRFKDSSGSYTRSYSDYITGSSATGYNEGWRKVSLTFTVPENAQEVRVYTLLRNATGTAYFDGLQLEIGNAANPYSLLDNASFENISSSKPVGWTLENTDSSDGSSTAHYHNGANSLKLAGEAAVNKYAYQNVKVSGSESDIYIVSGWAWAEALPDAEDITRSFDIFVRVFYSDNTSVFKSKQADFNRDVTGWQRASMAFDLDDGDDKNKRIPTEIRVGVRYYKQENEAYFDSMQLVKDVADSYTYDDEGNLITAKENGDQTSSLKYDGDNNLTSMTDAENNLYEYTYNDYKQVKTATAPLGQVVNYSYTAKGPLNYTIISSKDKEWQIRSGSVYNTASDGISQYAYVVKEKDQNGYATEYNIDLQSGLTKSVTTPDDVTTSYTYNTQNDLLTKVTSGEMSISYSYDASKTKLMKINHNGFDYNFTYSIYGNLKKTSVGSQALATNTYTAKNGKLKQTEYGNGDIRTYTYNKAGNLSSESMNGTATGSWTYDAAQQPLAYKDWKSKQEHTYTYDITGRLMETKVSDTTVTDTSKDSLLFTALYNYDSLNRLERTRIYAGSKSPYAVYSYNKNGQSQEVDFSTGETLSYTYDRLGRLLGKSVDTTTPIQYNYKYHLSERNENGSETYKTTLLKNEVLGDKGYQYEYDVMGNITKISEGTRITGDVNSLTGITEKITYEYDDYGQLIRENDLYTGTTVVYNYDNGGNITSKKIYNHTTADTLDGLPYEEVLYGYDSIWKDKLISYGGEAILYDEIGNPTTYLGKTLAWTGRTLDSLTQGGQTITYTYNADGLRTKKKRGNEETEYYYSNGLLSYEKRSDCELYYLYDADGQLAVIQYVNNNTTYNYYPVVNSRGDVEGFYNDSGELKVQYKYDAWGKLISMTDETVTDFGDINPIRYRGYYYDVETGFYYVSSRYYDPEVGRFISADATDILFEDEDNLLQYNLYTYCFNNPVNMIDFTGESPSQILGAIAGGIGGYALGKLLAKELGLKGAKKKALIAAAIAGGAALGAFLGPYAAKLGSKLAKKLGVKKAVTAACFVKGTLILSEHSKIPIEQIEEGDLVYSENPETGEKGLKRVVQTFEKETEEIIRLFIAGEEVITTPEHPFYIPQKGWTSAIQLRAGDVLILQNGEYVIVEMFQHEILESPITVYNFEVEDFHTYYVGEQSVLVHNACGMNNLRTLKETVIKGYRVSMDLERGGSGLVNIHLKVGNTKYYYKAGKFINSAGKEIPKALRNNSKIISALNKALSMKSKGW